MNAPPRSTRRKIGHLACARLIVGLLAVAGGLAPAACGGEEESRAAEVLLAAGDIGDCATQGDEATADLLAAHPDATIAVLGDVAYPHGTAEDFERCFAPSWGRFRDRMRAATGNHDHATPQAKGYAAYFGARGGPAGSFRYSYELGAWHVVVLDSDCWRVGGCDVDDPQARWLRADLRRDAGRCTLAYWHRPPFSSGRYGEPRDTERVRALWRIAVQEGVDVVLTAHEHSYERHAPMTAEGARDPGGTRLFVVGTGGGNLRRFRHPPLPSTEARHDDTWGVLRLDLRRDGYDWRFLPVQGGTFTDRGSGACR
jgi:acid phosphatase type 7